MARARWEKKKTNTLVHMVLCVCALICTRTRALTHTETCTHTGMADGTGQCICRLIKMRGGPTDRAFIRMRPKNTHAHTHTFTHTLTSSRWGRKKTAAPYCRFVKQIQRRRPEKRETYSIY